MRLSKKVLIGIFAGCSVLLLGYFLRASGTDVTHETAASQVGRIIPAAVSQSNSPSKAAAVTPPSSESKPKLPPLLARPAGENPAQATALEVIENARFHSPNSLRVALWHLKSLSHADAGASLLMAFDRSAGNLIARERVLWLATHIHAPQLFPMWKAVLSRESPRIFDEQLEAVDNKFNEPAAAAQMEQLQAVKALAALPNAESAKLLHDVVHSRIALPGKSEEVRFAAVVQLQRQDPAIVLKLASALKAQDPLRKMLASWAQAQRSKP